MDAGKELAVLHSYQLEKRLWRVAAKFAGSRVRIVTPHLWSFPLWRAVVDPEIMAILQSGGFGTEIETLSSTFLVIEKVQSLHCQEEPLSPAAGMTIGERNK